LAVQIWQQVLYLVGKQVKKGTTEMNFSFYEVFVKLIFPMLMLVALAFILGYLFAKAF